MIIRYIASNSQANQIKDTDVDQDTQYDGVTTVRGSINNPEEEKEQKLLDSPTFG